MSKRLFIILLSVSLLSLFSFIMLIGYLFFSKNIFVTNLIFTMLCAVIIILLFTLSLGIFLLVYTLLSKKPIEKKHIIMQSAVRFLFPIALKLGKLFNISPEKIKASFINVNNTLVAKKKLGVKAKDILILLPHCLQNSDCVYKITQDVENCRKCGKCQITDILDIQKKFDVNLFVVSGGTLARKYVKKIMPKLVIAVACERDLTSGILDVFPLPAYGILNIRPEGPCNNTRVNLKQLESTLLNFINC